MTTVVRNKAPIVVPEKHPFEIRYDRIEKAPWESCTKVLDESSRREALLRKWQ